MKKIIIFASSIFAFVFLILTQSFADDIIYVDNNNEQIKKVNLDTGATEVLYDYSSESDDIEKPWITGTNVRATNLNVHFVDTESGKVYLKNNGTNQFFIYDVINDTFSQSVSIGSTDNNDDFFFPLPTVATKTQFNTLNDAVSSAVALSSAIAALPNTSPDALYSCGVGTSVHNSSSAISLGCATNFSNYEFIDSLPKIFHRASFNLGSSFLLNGEPDLSEANDMSIKAGFTFKFGNVKPIRTTFKKELIIENKIDAVMQENNALKAQLKEENDMIRQENKLLKAQIADINLQLKVFNILALKE